MESRTYNIEELSENTGFSIRTIRYYIQEGILEPPAGRGRGGFYYDSHLKKLMEIKTLQDRGMKLAAIQEMLNRGEVPSVTVEREVWIKCPIASGIEIHVRRDLEEQERKKVNKIIKIARSILAEENEHE